MTQTIACRICKGTGKRDVFTYEQLDSRAQDKAFSRWYEGQDYPWGSDNRATLDAFCDRFGVTVCDFSYGTGRSYITINSVPDPDIAKLKGVRLWKYIQVWYDDIINKDCPFTGYFMDEDILDPFRAFVKRPDLHTTWDDLMRDCLESWLSACERDFEHHFSEERFKEDAIDLDWLFYADGTIASYGQG